MSEVVYGAGVDVVAELQQLLPKLLAKSSEQDRNCLAYSTLQTLVDRLKPNVDTDIRYALIIETAGMSVIEAIKHVRARTGLSLMESRDYVTNILKMG